MSPEKKIDILILDPELHSLSRIEKLVAAFPAYRLRSYTDCELALLLIKQLKPQVIVFDISTPGLDAVSFIDEILANDDYVPYLVALAPAAHSELLEKVISRSPDFVLGKERVSDSLPGILRMIVRHEGTYERLLRHDEELQSILVTQKEMICRFLPDTTLTYVNRAYAEIFDAKPEELLGRRFLELIPREEHAEIKALLASYSREAPTRTYRHRVHLPDGSKGWQEWTDYAFFHEGGEVNYFQSVGRDVTEEVLLKEALGKTEQQEREHISRELHDHVGQMLVVVKLRLEEYLMRLDKRRDQVIIREILDILGSTMEEVRVVSRRMVAGLIKGQSFKEAVEELLQSFRKSSQVSIKLNADMIPDKLSDVAKLHLYRILQEALVNSLKHSGANEVCISINPKNDGFSIAVRDNGRGVHMSRLRDGHGLRSIRYRVEQLGGELFIASELGKYYELSVWLPGSKMMEAKKTFDQS